MQSFKHVPDNAHPHSCSLYIPGKSDTAPQASTRSAGYTATRVASQPFRRPLFLLEGLIFCVSCHAPMVPLLPEGAEGKPLTYGCKGMPQDKKAAWAEHTIAEEQVERLVIPYIRRILCSSELIASAFDSPAPYLLEHFQHLEAVWDILDRDEQRRIIRALVEGIGIKKDGFEIRLNVKGLRSLIEDPAPPGSP